MDETQAHVGAFTDPRDERLAKLERQVSDLTARLAVVESFLATRFG